MQVAGSAETSVPIYLIHKESHLRRAYQKQNAGSSETLVPIYLTTRFHISQHKNIRLFSQLISQSIRLPVHRPADT